MYFLAIIVVFVTTYAMILPDISLDKEASETEAGMHFQEETGVVSEDTSDSQEDESTEAAVPSEEPTSYEVDQIRIVEPTDFSALNIVPGMDLCTLVTCTPYAVNTHRLLVRGHRVVNAQGELKFLPEAFIVDKSHIIPVIALLILLILLAGMLVQTERAKRRIRTIRAIEARYADPELLSEVRQNEED